MTSELTPGQRQIVETARAFALEQMRPSAAQWEADGHFDVGTLRVMAAIGFAAISVRQDVGGSELGRLESVLVFEQLARGCVGTAAYMSAHNMAAGLIDHYGADTQRNNWLPALCNMERFGAYAVTEPGAGSDLGGIALTAEKSGRDYVLSGAKAFVSGAGLADLFVVLARTSDSGPSGLSLFVVEKGTPGLLVGKNERKMGWHAQPMAQVAFDNCRIGASQRLGVEGEGYLYALDAYDVSRLHIAACAIGGATEALERTLEYAREREQFGRPIAEFQTTRSKLAEMATQIEAARLLTRDAACRLDAKDPEATKYCAMAKSFATDVCYAAADAALQIHGGYGYLADYEIERIVRDLRACQIVEGTNEMMRMHIAQEMMRR
jgi:alkylation response protein AidB-like acyl-CoA dehydrogenase